jgi:hypothetical protein
MTFPFIYVLYLELFHYLHFSSFCLSTLLMVIGTDLNILCLFLY